MHLKFDVYLSLEILILLLIFLILLSGFFSASETSIMSINRYRLKHLAKNNNKAKVIAKLLSRPDRLLAVILIGNNFANIAASSIATLIGMRLLGDLGILIATFTLTIIILIFGEITPKTFGALKPQAIAFVAAYPLKFLMWVIFPFVLLANFISNSILRLFGVKAIKGKLDPISLEELRTVVNESNTLIPKQGKQMLTGVLDLEKITVNDIMIPRTDVIGIDLENSEAEIAKKISTIHHTLLPVFYGDLNKIEGIIHMRDLSRALIQQPLTKKAIIDLTKKPLFIVEDTPLQTQLRNFQVNKKRLGLVVDEYGDILGLVTLEDILEEIVGEFTTAIASVSSNIIPQADGTFIVDGSANIRVLNRTMHWQLPTKGAKTLNGAILEYLEMIPPPQTCVLLAKHPIEILQVADNMIKSCKIAPAIVIE